MLAAMKLMGRVVPIHYQEPLRRDFSPQWQPAPKDFIDDLQGAINGGAAGWCFHNGVTFTAQGGWNGRPRRSFDMREQRLFEQLDRVEMQTITNLSYIITAMRADSEWPTTGRSLPVTRGGPPEAEP